MIGILIIMFEPKESWSEMFKEYLIGKKVLIIAFSFSEEQYRIILTGKKHTVDPKGNIMVL